MSVSVETRLKWVFLLTRLMVGVMFFMGAWWRVFGIGPLGHARRFFVEPYADSVLPLWSLWSVGVAIPFVELGAGALLLIGYRTRTAALVLGFELVVIAFGHFLAEPLFSISGHIFPRFILILVLLGLPTAPDRWSLDAIREGTGGGPP